MKRLIIALLLFTSYANAAIDANNPGNYSQQMPRLFNNWAELVDANYTGGTWFFDAINLTDANTTLTGSAGVLSVEGVKVNNDYFDVNDYGAGSSESAANNTTYIQAAIDAAATAGGGVILFSEVGTYQINDTIDVNDSNDLTIQFNAGAILHQTATEHAIWIRDGFERIKIKDAHIIGPGTYYAEGTDGKSLIESDANFVTIENCYLEEPYTNGIRAFGSNTVIKNNIIIGGPYYADNTAIGSLRYHNGIRIGGLRSSVYYDVNECIVTGNIIRPNTDPNAGRCIEGITAGSGGTDVDSKGVAYNCVFTNNTIESVWDHALYVNVEGSVISNNTITGGGGMKIRMPRPDESDRGNVVSGNNINGALTVPLSGDYGIALNNACNTLVSDNVIQSVIGAGIVFSGSDGTDIVENNTVQDNIIQDIISGTSRGGILIDNADGRVFRNNLFTDNLIIDIDGGTANYGIAFINLTDSADHTDNRFNNNTFLNIGHEALYLVDLTRGEIGNNYVWNNGVDAASPAIELIDCDTFEVKNNRLIGVSSQMTYGVSEDSSSSGNIYTNNTISDAATASLSLEQNTPTNSYNISTDALYAGIRESRTKIAGSTDQADDLHGIEYEVEMNDSDSTVGNLIGAKVTATVTAGTIGDGEEDVIGIYGLANVDGGTLAGDVFGTRSETDIESGVTSIAGNVYGNYNYMDVDKDPTGSVYGYYLKENTGQDYGYYQDGTAVNYFGGDLTVAGITKMGSDANNLSVSASGDVTFAGAAALAGVQLLGTATLDVTSTGQTTIYTVPAGKRCILDHIKIVSGATASPTAVVSFGQNGAATDFLGNQTFTNLAVQYDCIICAPVPNATPVKTKSYAAATVIEADVTTADVDGGTDNTVYVFGTLY